MSHQVKAEKIIAKPANEVFQAIQQGRLFMNCGADSRSMKVDFRVGGKYHVDFKNHGVSNWGEFLEIIPNRKIVFSWCQTFGADQKPDTKVTIDLYPDGTKTRLVLVHTGFNTKELADQHQGGWNGGIADMSEEVQVGKLRIVRAFQAPVDKVIELCRTQVDGKQNELVPSGKIQISWPGSQAMLTFNSKDGGGSSLEIIHDGLSKDGDPALHRARWETLTEKMSETLGGSTKFN